MSHWSSIHYFLKNCKNLYKNHNFLPQRFGHQNLLWSISSFRWPIRYQIPPRFLCKILYPFLVSVPFAFLNFCDVESSCNLTNSSLSTAVFDDTSFTFRGLGFPRSSACALVTAAATTPHSEFGSFGFLAPGIFPIIKSNRGSFVHIASKVPVQNGVSTSILAIGGLVSVWSTLTR